jgi:hypothetical protein
MFSQENLVYRYTREQAIQDGILKDITLYGAEFGFKVPLSITAGAWSKCVSVPAELVAEQDERGRLSDLLFLAACEARKNKKCSTVFFQGIFKNRVMEDDEYPEPVMLKLMIHPGDHMEPVATILLEHED